MPGLQHDEVDDNFRVQVQECIIFYEYIENRQINSKSLSEANKQDLYKIVNFVYNEKNKMNKVQNIII